MTTKTHGIQEIERRAAELLDHHSAVDERGYVNLHRMLERMGGRVTVDVAQRDRPESLVIHGPNDFTIFVPVNTSTARDRFTIAHELGHLVLHDDPDAPAPRAFYRYGRSRPETEANAFAGALVMPREHFIEAWHSSGGNLGILAERFGISRSAAEVRAKVLKLT
jgi:Zn-dependent peptidase ImmA (M78 family)